MGLIIRSSRIHAAGCYTTAPIKQGTKVVEYTGPRLKPQDCVDLYDDSGSTYLFGMEGDMLVIDGHGMAAFVNHSCDPNCETDEVDGHVWIVATRNIAPEEELTYDYNLYDGEDLNDAPCHCGAKKCRGTMYEPEEIARLKRLARQGKAKAPAKKKKPHRRAA
ncbi:MAG: SET domain-containing protein-lysine N-methyltransferase [Candidatus Koribacter versatilis]|uniref:SET domain-containing protein-lysine N-methyltransferase n=1 Tax=Candidatus Korobacter versatilis TaxID=658062 RepID=A0A932A6T5_9BACT|nr:SET domain-containing protein-lysine N-methyltransferase [Candidatus Koribacter versatilis]